MSTHNSASCAAAQHEPIKKTALGHVVVVTVRLDEPFALKPFRTFALDDLTGQTSSVADFTTLAAALQAHDVLVRGRQ